MAAGPVSLHVVRAVPALASLPDVAVPSRRVRFLLLHGFLAHSGSLNSLAANLRKGLDKHNASLLTRADDTDSVPAIDYEILSLDARNHGLSPHTPTHVLSDLVADFGHFLNISTPAPAPATGSASPATAPVTVAIGHSMGSATIAYYLMRRQAALQRGLLKEHSPCDSTGGSFSDFDVGSVPLSLHLFTQHIDAFVSMDMPPITGRDMSEKLHDELMEMLEEMEMVDLNRIVDMRSAHDEFVRCGIADIRIRGLCSTNLLFSRKPGGGMAAQWKINLPVLKHSLERYSLFFPDGFEDHPGDFALPLDVPVLSILGGASPIGGKQRLQAEWPRFASCLEQHIVPGATHTVFFDKPAETVTLVFEFLRRLGVLENQRKS